MNSNDLIRALVMGLMWEYFRINKMMPTNKRARDNFDKYCEDTINKCANLAHNPEEARLPGANYSDQQVVVWERVREVMINQQRD